MRVLRVTLEGVSTSFRYPHFMLGVQPSYDMPPPATIYGHVCSALGEWFDPSAARFAYRFTYDRKLVDLEHVHVLSAATGKLPGTQLPKVLEGRVNPFQREILHEPRLTLYLDQPAWEPAFRSPRYAVALGRSQDLCVYTEVRCIELEQRPAAYFEHTLLPFDYPLKSPQGVIQQMPKHLDTHRRRRPTFGQYTLIRQRIASDQRLAFGEERPGSFWVDPQTPDERGLQLGLVFMPFL